MDTELIYPVLRIAELAILFVLNIALHEAGHVVGAYMAGWKVKEIHIGEGSVFFSVPVGGAVLVWHWNMLFSGHVSTEVTEFRDYKLRQFYTVAGGLLATLALSGAFLLVWNNSHAIATALNLGHWGEWKLNASARYGTIFTAITFLTNAWPRQIIANGRVQATDGMLLWQTYTTSRSEILIAHHLLRVTHYSRGGRPGMAWRHWNRAERYGLGEMPFITLCQTALNLHYNNARPIAEKIWSSLLSRPGITPLERALLADSHATGVAFASASAMLHPEIAFAPITDEERQEALNHLNTVLTQYESELDASIRLSLVATKGTLCSQLGLDHEARLSLVQIITLSSIDYDRALAAAQMAYLDATTGNPAQAASLLQDFTAIAHSDTLISDAPGKAYLKHAWEEALLATEAALNGAAAPAHSTPAFLSDSSGLPSPSSDAGAAARPRPPNRIAAAAAAETEASSQPAQRG